MGGKKTRSGGTGKPKGGYRPGSGRKKEARNGAILPTNQEVTTRAQDSPLQGLTPQQVALFAAMLVNGGNISRAARSVGMNASYARRLVSTNEVFREAIRAYGDGMHTCLEEWLDLIPRAKAAMVRLLNDPDGKVRYLAAKDILDRAEGKPVSRSEVRVRDERPALSEGEVQLAFSLMRRRGISYAEAVEMIRRHPEEASRWIEARAVPLDGRNLPPDSATQEEEADAALLPALHDDWDKAAQIPLGDDGGPEEG